MQDILIRARGLRKRYRNATALDGIDLNVGRGRIVGLIGPNGAGKTTALKAIMGLIGYEGSLDVLGYDPRRARHRLMQDLSFIADVAVLPSWIRVRQAVDFLEGVHPRFDRERAMRFLQKTEIQPSSRVRELSKGMVTQLHLALVMGIDAKLLVLDEPTLGLDILYRQAFYEQLLNDYFDEQRTIIVTTHQVEEIERILTDVLFIRQGRIVLDAPMDEIPDRYIQVSIGPDQLDTARAAGPMYERQMMGQHVFLYGDVDRAQLEGLGELRVPSLTDLFIAKMKGDAA